MAASLAAMTLLVPLVLLAATANGNHEPVERAAPLAVHLRMDQPGDLSVREQKWVMDEIEAIWRPPGIRLTSGKYSDPAPAGAAVVSVRIVSETRRNDDRAALGWVVAGNDTADVPIIFVSAAGIGELLTPLLFRGRPLNQMPEDLRDRLVAQAIGRVVAHELGHYLLLSSEHAATGLMRPTYSSLDLLARSRVPFQLRAGDWPAARQGVARLAGAQTR